MVGIANLVNLRRQLYMRLLLGLRAHPIHGIHFLAQRNFERHHHLLDPPFAFQWKCTSYVGLTQRLPDIAIFGLNASAPQRHKLFRAE